MTFISQTRLRRLVNLNNLQSLANPVDVARFAGVVLTVEEAMSYVPPAQRPAVNLWGGFDLSYDLRCSIEVTILGMRRGVSRRVLVFYDVWLSPQERLAALPPVVRESLDLGFAKRVSRNAILDEIRRQIRDRIERLSLSGQTGDLRDPALVELADGDDPEGVLADARTLETIRDIDTAVTNPSSAPLLTMEPK